MSFSPNSDNASPQMPSLPLTIDLVPFAVTEAITAATTACKAWPSNPLAVNQPQIASPEARICDQLTAHQSTYGMSTDYSTGVICGLAIAILLALFYGVIRNLYRAAGNLLHQLLRRWSLSRASTDRRAFWIDRTSNLR